MRWIYLQYWKVSSSETCTNPNKATIAETPTQHRRWFEKRHQLHTSLSPPLPPPPGFVQHSWLATWDQWNRWSTLGKTSFEGMKRNGKWSKIHAFQRWSFLSHYFLLILQLVVFSVLDVVVQQPPLDQLNFHTVDIFQVLRHLVQLWRWSPNRLRIATSQTLEITITPI